ncbi:cell division protein FtsZ, partial [Rhodobacter ferrooxidans]
KNPGARPQATMQPTRPAAPAPRPADKPRFGIGSLINRMAGHAEPQAERAAPAPRQQPPVTSYDDEPDLGADQERIEIPAFLRRQAN